MSETIGAKADLVALAVTDSFRKLMEAKGKAAADRLGLTGEFKESFLVGFYRGFLDRLLPFEPEK
jgi:hypothetical protein